MNFRYRLLQFMSGRYGVDTAFYIITGAAMLLALINCFIFLAPIRFVIQIIVYLMMFYAIFRMLSRNLEARAAENRKISALFNKIKNNIAVRRQRHADITHVYRKCRSCKAVLRLPRRPGKHTTVCPKCSHEFSVTVRK